MYHANYCDQPWSYSVYGQAYCEGTEVSVPVEQTIVDLTTTEIGQIASAVLLLFATAFVFRSIRRYLERESAGRN